MGEPGSHFDFPKESLGPDVRRDFGAQHFDGDAAVMPQVARQEHDRHAALTKRAFYLVPTAQSGGQLGFNGGHRVGGRRGEV